MQNILVKLEDYSIQIMIALNHISVMRIRRACMNTMAFAFLRADKLATTPTATGVRSEIGFLEG